MRKKIIVILTFSLFIGLFSGCSKQQKPEKTADVEFTIVTGSDIPEELQELVDARKEKPFSLTFSDQVYLYVVKGYGKQACSGYEIVIHDFCKTQDGLYFDSELFGPQTEETDERSSYPYIVIKTEYTDLPVSFSE
ncbi:MAG: protease complex subunit PrcB family protein [Lachnospiraceae bacterium]|nr:protease complex subunit PrcB family protein [Lachnospiraceae bacterium]